MMSGVGAAKAKKFAYTLRNDNKKRFLEFTYTSCHGGYAWSNRYNYLLSYQIMTMCSYNDSSIRTSFVDAVVLFYRHKKVIINGCNINLAITECIVIFIGLDNTIRYFARPRDGY